MADFAIIKIGARQYKVSKGDVIDVDRLSDEVGKKLTFDEVLLTSKDSKVTVGTPSVTGMKVEGKVIDQINGKKVRTFKYKAKARYRKAHGHRAKLTQIEITKI